MEQGDVVWLPARRLGASIAAGELTPTEAVRAVLGRIAELNPALNAYIHVDLDSRPGRGRLAGLTLAVKDTQPVAGMPWTMGSRRWRDRIADADARPVARARSQGMAVTGKTNTPELAAAVGTANELFGPTANPWRADLTPGGSSGGSGAAVAAGLCTFATGDDMGGSIRIPASCCGVVGLRPTPGRVAEELPDPTRLSVRGPLARTVADARLAFEVMSGESPPAAGEARPLRIRVVRASPVPVDDACREACERAAAALESLGHELSPAAWAPEPVAAAYQVVRPGSVAAMPGDPGEYGEAAGRLIAEGRRTPVGTFLAALQAGLAAAAPVRDLLGPADAILTPTLGRLPMPAADVPPFLSEAWVSFTQFVLPVSFAGLPAVSVPAGLAGGIPVGVQLIGRPGREWDLLDLAERLEAAAGFGFTPPHPGPAA